MKYIDEEISRWLVDVRRNLHQMPEIMFQEVRTTQYIKDRLNEMGVEHYGFEDMTGVVAILRGGKKGKTLALRADIDALPIQEQTDVPFKSQNPNMMHACGHDAHTTIMLGVAKALLEKGLIKNLNGNVKFIFQPAEEGDGGADLMIKKGVLDNPNVDRILACHLLPDLPVGAAGVYQSQSHASTNSFKLIITGKGGHGARPDETIDPIVAASNFILGLQTIISRNISPLETAVIHVGKFVAGEGVNVVPEKAELGGTIRALDPDIRKILLEKIQNHVRAIELQFGVNCDLTIHDGYPVCINDTQVSSFLYAIGSEILGNQNIKYLKPSTGAEDFAFFALARPSAIIRLGCANIEKGIVHPLHSAFFNMDERVLDIGVDIFTEAVCQYLK